MYFEIVNETNKTYDIWHVREENKYWNEKFFHGFVQYLRDNIKDCGFIGFITDNVLCDHDRDVLGYKKDDIYFEEFHIRYRNQLMVGSKEKVIML